MQSFIKRIKPHSLRDFIGNPHVVSVLQHILKTDDAFGFLLCGPSGTGKTTLANLYFRERKKQSHIQQVIRLNGFKNPFPHEILDTIEKRNLDSFMPKGRNGLLVDNADCFNERIQNRLCFLMDKKKPPDIIVTCQNWRLITSPLRSRLIPLKLTLSSIEDDLASFKRINSLLKKPLSNEVLTSTVRDGKGDLRQTLLHLFLVGEGNDPKIIPNIDYLTLNYFFKAILSDFSFTIAKELCDKLWETGIDAVNLVELIGRETIVANLLKERERLQILAFLAEAEKNLQDGCSPEIQLTSLLAKICLLRTNQEEAMK